MIDPYEVVGEHYRWHRDTSEIEDNRDGTRRPDSDYSAKVDVYEDRVNSWFLEVALRQVEKGTCREDYLVLAVGLSYIEGVERYRQGREAKQGEAGDWFHASVRRIFPEVSESVAGQVWKAVRCGLFHCGFTDGPTLVSHRRPSAIVVEDGYLCLNPAALIQAVNEDFKKYVADLRANPDGELAKKFLRLWNRRWEETEVKRTS